MTPILSSTYGLILFILLCCTSAKAQYLWHLDKGVDNKSFGAGIHNTYKLLDKQKPTEIVVAVIDNGTDYKHKDLQAYIWTNSKEIPNNNIDDDQNGYVDDIHGWNFLGGDSLDIGYEALEGTRHYQRLAKKYADTTKLADAQKKELDSVRRNYDREQKFRISDVKLGNFIDKHKNNIALKTIARVVAGKSAVRSLSSMKKEAEKELEYNTRNSDSLRASIVGDQPMDTNHKTYGNNHINAADPTHGTHTAGIITGIADVDKNKNWLKIMPIRAVPVNGDERDKDVANAIRYAVDNGADIISMSFGKNLSPQRAYVIEAIKYAEQHDVLLVHGAGNNGRKLTRTHKRNFPNYWIDSTNKVKNWIEVGASSKKRKKLVASFSNYGYNSVDILAPGVDIYSTTPDNKYEYLSGTSMAAPVVAGVAAIIRSYYPYLTAEEVKNVLITNVTTTKQYVPVPGNKHLSAQLWYICQSAGIVNAEKCVKAIKNSN